jgi:integrase
MQFIPHDFLPLPALFRLFAVIFDEYPMDHSALEWLEAGLHIKAVADLLGHASIAITGDVYGHTSDGTARAASN